MLKYSECQDLAAQMTWGYGFIELRDMLFFHVEDIPGIIEVDHKPYFAGPHFDTVSLTRPDGAEMDVTNFDGAYPRCRVDIRLPSGTEKVIYLDLIESSEKLTGLLWMINEWASETEK